MSSLVCSVQLFSYLFDIPGDRHHNQRLPGNAQPFSLFVKRVNRPDRKIYIHSPLFLLNSSSLGQVKVTCGIGFIPGIGTEEVHSIDPTGFAELPQLLYGLVTDSLSTSFSIMCRGMIQKNRPVGRLITSGEPDRNIFEKTALQVFASIRFCILRNIYS